MQNKNAKSLFGCDVNEFRGNIDFAELKKQVQFMYLRSSGSGSGKFRVDKRFFEYAKGCRQFNIPVGAYHYGVPSYDISTADSQCDDFIKVLQEGFGVGDYGDLFPVLDVEEPTDKSVISSDALINWINRFRNRFQQKTRRKLMLYTSNWYISLFNNFKSSTKGYILSNMPLWIAYYEKLNTEPVPPDAGGWTRWRIWQYTDEGVLRGLTPPVDLNWGPDSIDLLVPPRKVKNLKAAVNGNKIYITWDPNTDVDLAGYNLFLNSSYIKTLGKSEKSYTINKPKALIEGMPVEISIEAFDRDGDFSVERSKVDVIPNRPRKTIFVEDDFSDICNKTIEGKECREEKEEEFCYENKLYCSYPEFYKD